MASEAAPAPFDEERPPDSAFRARYADTLAALQGAGLTALAQAIERHLEQAGVTFGGEPFAVDPVPRLISAREWEGVEAGLAQRTRALNAFLHDAYGERRIVAAGLVEAGVIDGAEGYEPDLAGRLPRHAAPAAIIGFDLVREPGGAFLVVEDNLRTPSGLAYLLAARAALQATLPAGIPRPRPVQPAVFESLTATLHAAAPDSARGDGHTPQAVLITDGPQNVAYYEHAHLAEGLAVALVTPDDLFLEGDRLYVRLADSVRRVDVVYRRTNEDRIRDESGRMTTVARLLMPAWLAGQIGLVNAFGNGVADDKLVHGHVEDFVRFYLEEEPLVRSVPTMPLEAALGDEPVARLRELVVKPRHGHGGHGVTIGTKTHPDDLRRLARELSVRPGDYIAQPIVPLSRHPTVIDGRLEPRHVDLRPFAFCTGEEVALAPGGLSRVAFDAGEMVVNSSRNGGGKDTWVLDEPAG
jgi:uncharacterized circularly permuted ATP-grasp superfamily protein